MVVVNKEKAQEISKLYSEGWSLNKLAENFSISKSTIYYNVRKRFGLKHQTSRFNLSNKELLGEFLGLFAGDGNFEFDAAYHYRVTIFLSPKERKILNRTVHIISQLFGKKPWVWYNKRGNCYYVRVYGKRIFLLLKKFLSWGKNKTLTISFNDNVFRDRRLMKGIIRGLINSDGNIYEARLRISFGSISKTMIEQSESMLTILSVPHTYSTSAPHQNHKRFYTIAIEGEKKVLEFNSKIGLIDSEKQDILQSALNMRQSSSLEGYQLPN